MATTCARAAVVGLCLIATACGGGDGSDTTTTSGGEVAAPATTSGAAPGPTATVAAATTTAAPDPCAVRGQGPPSATVPANNATALAFAPDGRLFWAERSGTVRVWQDGAAKEFARVATVTTEAGGGYSERGLLGLAVNGGYVYAFHSNTDRLRQSVVRWKDCGGTAGEAEVVVELPGGTDCCHKGGRLAFGPDGKLYVTLGELHVPSAAQNTSDVRGKVLRYNPDGSVPGDNPFGNAVWAYGFRNVFGIAFGPNGQLAVTVNGPTGDAGSPSTGYDTVVASVEKGKGYQWPRCYGYGRPLTASSCGDGQPDPDWSSESATVVPTGATFVDGSGPAGYAGKLVFCSVAAGMQVFTPGSPRGTVTAGPRSCALDVKQGPDKALYYSDTGNIYRLA